MKKQDMPTRKYVDSIIAPEEVSGTSNDCVITRCAVYFLLLAVCLVALIVTN